LLTTYVPALKDGTVVPICPSYDVLKESGRTSSFKPNIQNLPRKGKVRGCFTPRPGHVYIVADYSTLELRCWAQACIDLLGHDVAMAKAIREGRDLHLEMAAQLLELDYDVVKARFDGGDADARDARQLAKVANFGFPGGMGPSTFSEYASAQGVPVSIEKAEDLRRTWLERWPEAQEYFNYVASLGSFGNDFDVVQLRSSRVRGGCTFTSGCNTYFQGLAADGAKAGLWRVAKEEYVVEDSPLFGCRTVAFVHDELLVEAPHYQAGPAATRLVALMIEAMRLYTPDVPQAVEVRIGNSWSKDALPARSSEAT